MYSTVRDKAIAFHQSFHKSGVIVFARLQVVVGCIWSVLIMTDLSPLIADRKYLTYWLIASGVITEMSRRHGTSVDDQNHLVPPHCIDPQPGA
jgi:hypothetical protein